MTYIFHEWDDHLALCPISHLTALVLVDEAFQALEIQSAQDVYQFECPEHRCSLQLKRKPAMYDTPIFRRTAHTAEGIRISPNRALEHYHTMPSTNTSDGLVGMLGSNGT
jgi:Protein of unknown function (DUF3435)